VIQPDAGSPQVQAAMAYMEHKGYPEKPPLGIDSVEDDDGRVWYFYFEVPEGLIELEVDHDGSEWWCSVVGFLTYNDQPEGWTPAAFVQQHLGRVDSAGG